MIKLTFALTRRADLTREAFQAYWLETHAPLVARLREPLRIRRYVQLHSLPAEIADTAGAGRGGLPGYDGVAQLWWDSFEDMAASAADPAAAAAAAALREDEEKFIDFVRSPLWWGQERAIF